jgi:adenylate cyclase
MRVGDDMTNDELWYELLTDPDSPIVHQRGRYRRYPGNPRCKQCLVPLGGTLAPVVRLVTRKVPGRKNPNYCNICEEFVEEHPGGAEIELTLLFADVRGSTTLAERMSAAEFSKLLNRFHTTASNIVINSDGLVDKLVGDEIVGLYAPNAGFDHAARAVRAAIDLLEATGHRDGEGPWLPVGAGVHMGVAYVGAVGLAQAREFTALGDPVNVAARLASVAAAGELVVSEEAFRHAGLELGETESRRLELKGKSEPTDVRVVRVSPAVPAGVTVNV